MTAVLKKDDNDAGYIFARNDILSHVVGEVKIRLGSVAEAEKKIIDAAVYLKGMEVLHTKSAIDKALVQLGELIRKGGNDGTVYAILQSEGPHCEYWVISKEK